MTRIPFDPEAIRLLADILAETGLTEIEISEKDSRIRLVRTAVATAGSAGAPLRGAVASARPAEESSPPGTVHSPMVGIAYLSPEPGAAPFVQPGQRVSAGQTLLLVEAMKTFNQIKAPREGVVLRVLVSSGAPVEYDEPLLILGP